MAKASAKKLCVISLVTFVCMALALEAGVRLFVLRPHFYRMTVSGTNGEYMLSPDPALVYLPRPNTGQFNAYGYRGRVFPFRRRAGMRRVVVMGDSVVHGLRIHAEDRFTEVLGRRFGNCEFINLGVCGYSLRQEVAYFKAFAHKFQPDYVIWGICCNDLMMCSAEYDIFKATVSTAGKNGFYNRYYAVAGAAHSMLQWSAVYTCIRAAMAPPAGPEPFGGYADKDPAALLDEADRLARKYHFKNVFLLLPTNTADLDPDLDLLRTRIRAHPARFALWDHAHAMDAMDRTTLFLLDGKDPWHLTVRGNAVLAALVEPEVRGLLESRQ